MKRRSRSHFRPQLEILEGRCCPSTTRPIADFLGAQGTTSLFPNGINPGGPAGMPDETGAGTNSASWANGTARFARIDYTGQDAAFLHLNLGTTTSGSISERVLADGTAEDTVILHTHNAFAWANNADGITNPVVFGYLPSQLAADPTLRPPLADSTLHVVVQIPHPGAPLPDLVVLVNLGGVPGYTLVSLGLHATATGTTPTGQQATLVVSQTDLQGRTPHLTNLRDVGFTAEVVDIQVHGNAAPAAAPAAPTTPVAPVQGNASSPVSPAAVPTASVAPAPLSSAHASASQLSAIDDIFVSRLDDPLTY